MRCIGHFGDFRNVGTQQIFDAEVVDDEGDRFSFELFFGHLFFNMYSCMHTLVHTTRNLLLLWYYP